VQRRARDNGANQTVDPRFLHFIALVELVVRALGNACTKKSGPVFNEKLHDFIQSWGCPLHVISNEETSNTETHESLAILFRTDLCEGLDVGLLAHFQEGGSKTEQTEFVEHLLAKQATRTRIHPFLHRHIFTQFLITADSLSVHCLFTLPMHCQCVGYSFPVHRLLRMGIFVAWDLEAESVWVT
jgi:hypothetical protein